MNTIKIGMLTLAVMLVAAVTASAASAYEWQINGTGAPSNTPVKWTSTIHFENIKEGYAVECKIQHVGTIGSGGLGKITSITSTGGAKVIPCAMAKSSVDCESAVELEAVNLPWSTELAVANNELQNKPTGSPEWKFTCKPAGGGLRTNKCAVASTIPHNVATGVEQEYVAKPFSLCQEDFGETLRAYGAELITSTSGTTSISPGWQVGGAGFLSPLSVEWKGKIKLTDTLERGGVYSAECTEKAEGEAGPFTGTVTKFTLSSCIGIINKEEHNKCETTTVETVHLPWDSELVTSGAIHDVMESGGSGTPGFTMKCTVVGITETLKCTGVINPVVTNGSTGVTATFVPGEKLTCIEPVNNSVSSGSLEDAQTIESNAGGKLEVR
jgi:hypothetical protein